MHGQARTLWDRQADQWSEIRPPLRPSGDDLVWAQEAIDGAGSDPGGSLRALVLGATPELIDLRWPAGSMVLSLERSMPMIVALRRSAPPGSTSAHLQGDWADGPFTDGSFDLVLGDGSLNTLPRARVEDVLRSVHRSMGADGRLALRAYIRPDVREAPDEIWDRLIEHQFPSFGIFKFHLLMSFADADGDTAVADVWRYFQATCASPRELAADLGWPVPAIETIHAYRDQPDVYWFPTLGELRELLAVWFDELSCRWPRYEMGDRCPSLLLRARQ